MTSRIAIYFLKIINAKGMSGLQKYSSIKMHIVKSQQRNCNLSITDNGAAMEVIMVRIVTLYENSATGG